MTSRYCGRSSVLTNACRAWSFHYNIFPFFTTCDEANCVVWVIFSCDFLLCSCRWAICVVCWKLLFDLKKNNSERMVAPPAAKPRSCVPVFRLSSRLSRNWAQQMDFQLSFAWNDTSACRTRSTRNESLSKGKFRQMCTFSLIRKIWMLEEHCEGLAWSNGGY